MKKIGIVYAISQLAGELCKKNIEKIGGYDSSEVLTHGCSAEKYKLATNDLNKIANLVLQSIDDLQKRGAKVVIIAANSIHRAFSIIDEGVKTKYSDITLISIVNESVKECIKRNYKRIAIFGSNTTVTSSIYQDKLKEANIEVLPLTIEEQSLLNEIIVSGERLAVFRSEKRQLVFNIVNRLKEIHCDGIILACTELPLLFNTDDLRISIVDTNQILAQAAVDAASTESQTTYMYSTAKDELEEKRLAGLNILYNPSTIRFLSPFLTGKKKILELGCGSGTLAAEVLSLADNQVEYLGIDRDPAQVQHSIKALKRFPNSHVVQIDIVNDFETLRKQAPFDLIYCRWLLVHLPSKKRVEVIKNILGLLSKNGVFLCDECDNRNVRFKPIESASVVRAPYQEATRLWSIISKGLMQVLGNDLEYTSEKIQEDFLLASDGIGEVKVEGQYHVILRGKSEKKLLTDGYRSSSELVSQVCNKPFEEIIEAFDKCVENESIEIEFLTENVVTYRS